MPEEKPKSNMEIAVEALKAEAAAEIIKPNPNWVKMTKLTQFLRSQREAVPNLEDAIREQIAVAQGGVGAYVTEDDSDPNNFAPYMRRARTPLMPSNTIFPPEVQTLIDKVIEISPFQADKAKKMLECADLIEGHANFLDTEKDKDKINRISEFTDKLREKAMDILSPELGDLPEEVKPAIRPLDLNDTEDKIDAEFGVK